MKKLLVILFYFLFSINFVNAESRFGELTEIRDERMRGKEGQWEDLIQDLLSGTI